MVWPPPPPPPRKALFRLPCFAKPLHSAQQAPAGKGGEREGSGGGDVHPVRPSGGRQGQGT